MDIRKANSDEVQECEAVLRAAFDGFVRRLGRNLREDAYSGLPDEVSEARVLVAIDQSSIRGVAIYSLVDNSWNIDQVAVRPVDQGRGVGSALIERISSDAKAMGVATLRLDTVEFMSDLLRLYRRHGFEVAEKGLPKHGRDNFMRVFMRKNI
ncbi:GNAT family N-acetyltransferase [Limimaricola soesokkakensis]|uniref:GNAT family N-acetyltransferase n=1 Tax=Limimaricola soesokkakensis TaxID=1343159 RepID=UPI003517BD99